MDRLVIARRLIRVVAPCSTATRLGGMPSHVSSFVVVGVIGLIPLIGFVIFPMLKFKPQTRTLTVDDRGIETTIGIINASVPWKDISEVRDDGEYLIIRRTNQNAFIVPPRAFGGVEDRLEFREFVSSMAKANVRLPPKSDIRVSTKGWILAGTQMIGSARAMAHRR